MAYRQSGGTTYYIHKLLRYVPVREVLIMIAESDDRSDKEMKSVLRGGEGCRILAVSFIVDFVNNEFRQTKS